MSGNLFRSVGGMKNLGQALRRCSTDCKNSGKATKTLGGSFRRSTAEFVTRHTEDMREFFRDDGVFSTATNFGFAAFAIVCAVRSKRNHYDIHRK
ncbi:hypothetical protein OROHE_012172 [Orobanche hederae]